MLEQIKDNVYKINKHQYLKINKSGNGEIIAPPKKDITKSFWEKGNKDWHNLIFTGGTFWGLLKVILIVLLLLIGVLVATIVFKDTILRFFS